MQGTITKPDARTWREDLSFGMFSDAGHVGGDIQIGPAYSRRYVFGPVEGRWLLVTEYAYASRWGALNGEDPDPERPYSADEQTEYLICTDPDDPGGTELDAEYDYGQGSVFAYETEERADEEARRMIRRGGPWAAEHYDPTDELRRGGLRRLYP